MLRLGEAWDRLLINLYPATTLQPSWSVVFYWLDHIKTDADLAQVVGIMMG
jgi:hypothetical protein